MSTDVSKAVREQENQNEAYAKTLLYLYPYFRKMAKTLRIQFENKARLAYRHTGSAESLLFSLYDCGEQARFLDVMAGEFDELISSFCTEERYVLEYRYFRRKKVLEQFENPPAFSLRTFYRRQHTILKKVIFELLRRGFTKSWFEENFGEMDWAMTVYKKVKAGKDAFILGKFKNSPFFKVNQKKEQDERVERWERGLPCPKIDGYSSKENSRSCSGVGAGNSPRL